MQNRKLTCFQVVHSPVPVWNKSHRQILHAQKITYLLLELMKENLRIAAKD